MTSRKISYIFISILISVFFIQPFSIYSVQAQTNVTSFLEVATFFPEFSISRNVGRATLKGYIDTRENVRSTNTWFEWGETPSLGKRTSSKSRSSSGQFTYSLSNLDPNKYYYYRAGGQDAFGSAFGDTIRFRISDGDTRIVSSAGVVAPPLGGSSIYPAPEVTTRTATVVNGTSVILSAKANIGTSLTTSGYFEWGTTPNLENQTPVKNLGAQPSVDFSDVLFGLTPNTQYYYRAVVINPGGKSIGTTLPVFTNIAYNTGQFVPQTPTTPTPNTPTQPAQPITQPTTPQKQIPTESLGSLYAVTYVPNIVQTTSDAQVQFKGYVEVHENKRVKKGANVWFEWGETPALGNLTSSQFFGGKGTVISQEKFIGFTNKRLYYYRVAVQDPYGIAYGDIVSFSVSNTERQATTEDQGLFNIFSGTQTGIIDIRNINGNTFSEEVGDETVIPNQDQIAIVSASKAQKNGIFPNTFLGWALIVITIFIMVGLILYIGELTKKLKKIEEQDYNREGLRKDNT